MRQTLSMFFSWSLLVYGWTELALEHVGPFGARQ
jgi:hypothetical protein